VASARRLFLIVLGGVVASAMLAGCLGVPSDPLGSKLDLRAQTSCASGFGGWNPEVIAAVDADLRYVSELYRHFGVAESLDPNLSSNWSTYAAVCWLADPDSADSRVLYYRLDDGRSNFIFRAPR
jgi:hypothetical protein